MDLKTERPQWQEWRLRKGPTAWVPSHINVQPANSDLEPLIWYHSSRTPPRHLTAGWLYQSLLPQSVLKFALNRTDTCSTVSFHSVSPRAAIIDLQNAYSTGTTLPSNVYSTGTTLPSKNGSIFMTNRCNNEHMTTGLSGLTTYPIIQRQPAW